MARVGQALGALAALLLLAVLLLGYLPNPGEAIVDFRPPGTEIYGQVDCGTPFRSTQWSHDDGCEGPYLGRGGAIFMAVLGAIVSAAVGLVLWVASQRPGRPS